MDDIDRTVILSEEESNSVKPPVEQERLTKLLDMAFWHKQVGNTKSAILACEAAIVLDNNSTTAHSLLGSLYEKQGDIQKAIVHMERAVALNPNNPMEQARLDQLRHDALQQTATSGGLVNMLAARSAAAREESLSSGEKSKLLPALVAVAVVAGIITIGLYAIKKPQATTSSNGSYTQTQARPGPGPGLGITVPAPVAVAPRMSMGSSPDTVVAMPKAALAPATSLTPAEQQRINAAAGADPFAVGAPPDTSAPAKLAANQGKTSDKAKLLPPISIGTTDSTPSNVAPAPVTVPVTTGTAVTPLSQHTVVVDQLPNQPASAPSSYQSQVAAPYDPGNPEAHIHITVDQDSGSSSNPTRGKDNTIVVGASSPDAGVGADGLQSQALALQQQGDYGKAEQAYTKAIHLYNGQIASGHDVETARRALRSCQTGLKICQASQ